VGGIEVVFGEEMMAEVGVGVVGYISVVSGEEMMI